MAQEMEKKFDKYWDSYSIILAIAVVFDPRYKLIFVRYDKIYSLDSTVMEKFNLVKLILARLFEEYQCMEITEEDRGLQSHAIEDNTVGDVLDWEELSMYESSTINVIQDKSELDLYLEAKD
ncbi:zinc finger BED domain-containing protein RICESLEEPER 1-like isoform X2 [Macadamia integrifolia]|nr:zinc finger BED domain-containing protein RICESLEEPER 1-like isoform X2 [Macadamia integrifolia]